MNISRTLFLAMTGAIASGACYVETAPPPPPPPPRVAYYPPAPPPPPTPAAAETSYYNAPRPAPPELTYWDAARGRIVRRRARPVGLATAEPGYRPPPPNFGVVGPSSESVGPAPGPPAVAQPAPQPAPAPAPLPGPAVEGCLDTESMAVPSCSEVKVPASCGIRSFVMDQCNAYHKYMDAKVAAVAIGCMANLGPTRACEAEATYACGKVALSEACVDPDLSQMCKIAATSCKTTANDCTALLSGLSDTGKQKVAECISKGCHAGLYSCVEGLR